MNKELPSDIKVIFDNPDPIIWNGFWLACLQKMLDCEHSLNIWSKLLVQINVNHKKNKRLSLKKYIKWEIKAFVAKTIKLIESSVSQEMFIIEIQEYLELKNLTLHDQDLIELYRDLNDN
tara:strand:+ start:17 stop:376 length:360 start_codon:yes stop_codon:yes gene_type:complete